MFDQLGITKTKWGPQENRLVEANADGVERVEHDEHGSFFKGKFHGDDVTDSFSVV
jgi:hypothetical protein